MALKIPARRPGGQFIPNSGQFTKGHKRGGPGRPVGSQNKLTEMKHMLIASTGMSPIEFLTFVYRDQLYDAYDEKIASDGKTTYFEPKRNAEGKVVAKKIDVSVNQRITCALGAAPYIHKKMPVGVEVKDGKNMAVISTEKLRSMPTAELERLLDFMDKFGLSIDLASTAEAPSLPGSGE